MRPADHGTERSLAELRDVGDRVDAVGVQLLGGLGADAPQPAHRKRVQEGQFAVGRDQQQPVGLGLLAGDLRQELGAGDADGDGQPDVDADPLPQLRRDLHRRARHPCQPTHVEEGLVDRQRFDEGSGVAEHLEHRGAGLRVRRHARWHDDGVRTQLPGLAPTHRGAHAVGLGLVAGGEHHPAADDHGPPPQRRVVALLDRRVERVEVSVQDGRRAASPGDLPTGRFVPARRHEHMFASEYDAWVKLLLLAFATDFAVDAGQPDVGEGVDDAVPGHRTFLAADGRHHHAFVHPVQRRGEVECRDGVGRDAPVAFGGDQRGRLVNPLAA